MPTASTVEKHRQKYISYSNLCLSLHLPEFNRRHSGLYYLFVEGHGWHSIFFLSSAFLQCSQKKMTKEFCLKQRGRKCVELTIWSAWSFFLFKTGRRKVVHKKSLSGRDKLLKWTSCTNIRESKRKEK